MESNLLVENKSVVVPGQVLAKGMEYLPGNGTYRHGDEILANRLGLLFIDGKVLKSIEMAGRYLPKVGDTVIGRVIDILMTGWRIEINSPYTAVLPVKDASHSFIKKGENLTKYFELDDYLVCKIVQVTSQNLIDVSCKGPGLRRLKGGRIVKANPNKVPRIIGKKGSMVSMIKKYTDCQITVGQNGLIWVSGEPEDEVLAIQTIKKIEEESHRSGLTEDIEKYLQDATKGRKKKEDGKND